MTVKESRIAVYKKAMKASSEAWTASHFMRDLTRNPDAFTVLEKCPNCGKDHVSEPARNLWYSYRKLYALVSLLVDRLGIVADYIDDLGGSLTTGKPCFKAEEPDDEGKAV